MKKPTIKQTGGKVKRLKNALISTAILASNAKAAVLNRVNRKIFILGYKDNRPSWIDSLWGRIEDLPESLSMFPEGFPLFKYSKLFTDKSSPDHRYTMARMCLVKKMHLIGPGEIFLVVYFDEEVGNHAGTVCGGVYRKAIRVNKNEHYLDAFKRLEDTISEWS